MNFEKERLKGSNILPQTLYYSELRTDILLRLHIPNYSKLKNKVFYYISSKSGGYKWTYKLMIANETLFVFMCTTTNMKRHAFYIYKANSGYVVNFSKQEKNFIASEFCNKAIMDPNNGYLHFDNLYIKFQYEMEQSLEASRFTNYGTMDSVTDGVELRKNLKYMYMAPRNADLKIQVQDEETFWAHKAILAVSSKAFADIFEMNQPPCNKISHISIKENPRIFHIVLIYLYSGELNYVDEDDIFLAYEMAYRLEIDVLKTKCMNYFKDKFSPSNVLDIMAEAKVRDLVELLNAGIDHINENCSDLSGTPQYQEIVKGVS